MKNKNLLLAILGLSLCTVSCSNDDTKNEGENVKLIAKSTYGSNSVKTAKTTAKNNSTVEVTSFKINIKEIEFEMDDDFSSGDGFYDDDDDIELKGPFELSILGGATEIVGLNIPNGVYEEVEFKIHKSNNSSSDMFNKSIKMEGTINAVPFIFWHNVEEDFEIDYEDTNQQLVVTENAKVNVVFDFDLNAVLANVDLSSAVDGNKDGIIEISPNDPDGNRSLANKIKDKIKDFCDLED
ncbi:hypothetical protein AAGV33_05820 [Flavobacterium sp. FBOR7N2.3]|uniref:DUF4382 domain-containing protein n=2 Tax=Flavobacterium TaxID=237 RepID=A0ABV4T865_9FLAO